MHIKFEKKKFRVQVKIEDFVPLLPHISPEFFEQLILRSYNIFAGCGRGRRKEEEVPKRYSDTAY